MLPNVDHVKAEPVADFEIVSWQTNEVLRGTCPLRRSSLTAAGLFRSQNNIDHSSPWAWNISTTWSSCSSVQYGLSLLMHR